MTKFLRKISLILLFVVMVATLALATACGIFSDTCSHDEAQLIVLKEPTATEKGQVVRRCLVCNKTVYPYWETYPLNDYTKYDEYDVTKAPTHTESGHVKVTLAFSSYNVLHFEGDISPTQHKLNIFVPVDAQYHVATCSCGEQGEQSPHDFRKTDNVAATCVEPGYLQYTCTDCNYTYKNYLSDQLGGHVYENGRCKNCGDRLKQTITYVDGSKRTAKEVYWGDPFEFVHLEDKYDQLFDGWCDKDGKEYSADDKITADIEVHSKWIDVYDITEKIQFLDISNHPDRYYRLANDINLGGEILPELPLFSGVLDGNGHVVKNFGFQIRDSLSDYHGLIKVNEGTIRDITFRDYTASIDITQAYFAKADNGAAIGGIVGHNKGTVEQVNVQGAAAAISVKVDMPEKTGHDAYVNVGGVVGNNSGTIRELYARLSCTVNIDIYQGSFGVSGDLCDNDSYFYIGSICGTNIAEVNQATNTGNITVTNKIGWEGGSGSIRAYQYVGGLFGRNLGNVTEAMYGGKIQYYKSDISWPRYEYTTIGGLAALNYGSIGQSFAAATVYGASDTSYNVGGFVGQNLDEAKIAACYAISTIVVSGSNNRIGGFVGTNQAMIQSCYASGEITMQAKAKAYVGGFAGYNDKSGSILRSFVATMKLSATEGYAGQFVAENLGTTRKAYYALPDETNNYYNAGAAEVGSMKGITDVTSKAQDELLQNDLLSDALYWNEDGWVLADGKMPTLQWLIDCGLVEE